ncbi:hypothetical protein ACFQVA_08750 [Actinomadura keratinilytica]
MYTAVLRTASATGTASGPTGAPDVAAPVPSSPLLSLLLSMGSQPLPSPA